VLNHGSDLVDFNALTFKLHTHLEVFDEVGQVLALEEHFKLVQKGVHILKVDEILVLAKLELKQVEN